MNYKLVVLAIFMSLGAITVSNDLFIVSVRAPIISLVVGLSNLVGQN